MIQQQDFYEYQSQLQLVKIVNILLHQMLLRQTQQYLKTNQIKHSSFYSKPMFQVSKLGFMKKEEGKQATIDEVKNFSMFVQRKSASVEVGTSRGMGLRDSRLEGQTWVKRKCGILQLKSQRNRKRDFNHEGQLGARLAESPQRQEEKKSKMALRKLKNEIIFQNQLLTKPIAAEYFPKIKLTKRKFRLPKSKQVSQYCPWLSLQEQDNPQQHSIFNF